MLNKVTKNECIDALHYFFVEGFIDNLNQDQQHYVMLLMKRVANTYNIKLEDERGVFSD